MVCSHSQEIGPGFAARGLLSLAAEPQLAENSHQGSERNKSGRCIQKSAASATMNYLYDGKNAIESVDQAGNILSRYTDTLRLDEVLAVASGEPYYYEEDGVGSITSLSSSAATLISTYVYDTYGNLAVFTGTANNPLRYTAREFDSETGNYYYRARYYDAGSGRFLSEDPIGFVGGTDFYRYVRNSPTNFMDPDGLLQVCCRPAHLPPVEVGAWLSGHEAPCHCFVKLSDGHTLGGYFSWNLASFAELVKHEDDKTDHDKYAREAGCTDAPGGCDSDERAKRAFDAIPPDLGDYGFGAGTAGSSNRVAATILSNAGINASLPSCAWGQQVPPPIGHPHTAGWPK